MVAEIWASVISPFVDQWVALIKLLTFTQLLFFLHSLQLVLLLVLFVIIIYIYIFIITYS